jgi:hypothetical protein
VQIELLKANAEDLQIELVSRLSHPAPKQRALTPREPALIAIKRIAAPRN